MRNLLVLRLFNKLKIFLFGGCKFDTFIR